MIKEKKKSSRRWQALRTGGASAKAITLHLSRWRRMWMLSSSDPTVATLRTKHVGSVRSPTGSLENYFWWAVNVDLSFSPAIAFTRSRRVRSVTCGTHSPCFIFGIGIRPIIFLVVFDMYIFPGACWGNRCPRWHNCMVLSNKLICEVVQLPLQVFLLRVGPRGGPSF